MNDLRQKTSLEFVGSIVTKTSYALRRDEIVTIREIYVLKRPWLTIRALLTIVKSLWQGDMTLKVNM